MEGEYIHQGMRAVNKRRRAKEKKEFSIGGLTASHRKTVISRAMKTKEVFAILHPP